jgi:succinate dehydrogenase flavin-adding protein (antitoxin of CptAB toxin-antitoxin module)
MLNLFLIKETTVFDEETDYETYETETEELVDENINSFEELLEELDSNHHITNWSWGEWSERRPVVDGDGRRAWITSATEENMMMYAEERTTLHFNPARGVRLDKVQIKMIEKALGMR